MSPEGGSLLQMLVPLAMVFAIFYFIVIVPSKRQQKKVQEFVDNLKVNDKVITTSGIYGQIMKLDEQAVQLQVANNVQIKVSKAAIGGYQGQEPVVEPLGSTAEQTK